MFSSEHRTYSVKCFICKLKLNRDRSSASQSEKVIFSLRFKVKKIIGAQEQSVFCKKDCHFLWVSLIVSSERKLAAEEKVEGDPGLNPWRVIHGPILTRKRGCT